MMPRWMPVLLIAFTLVPSVHAQAPWQFRWAKGQVLSYKVKHGTAVAEVIDGSKVQTFSRLDLVKRWHVKDVDAQGTATLELSLAAMRNEQIKPNGEVLLFDSEDFEKSTPGLREHLAKYVKTTLAVLRVDAAGKVVEVKQGSAASFGAELPFVLTLPAAAVKEGEGWTRAYDVALEPPLGTGEKYPAEQQYHVKQAADGKATIAVTTRFKTLPETMQERLPLLPKEVEGEVTFDVAAGRLAAARLRIDRTVEDHQGPRSSYHFRSEYTEELIP